MKTKNKKILVTIEVTFPYELDKEIKSIEDFIKKHEEGGGWCKGNLIEDLYDYSQEKLRNEYECMHDEIKIKEVKAWKE